MTSICLISPSLQMGGIERALSTLANFFVSKGLEVHFVTIFPFEKFFELDPRIHLHEPDIKFYKKEISAIKNLWYYFQMLSPIQGRIQKKIRQINPDAIMSFGDWFPHLLMLGLKNKYPFFYCNRSNPNISYSIPIEFVRWLAYKITPPSGIIAQTTHAKNRKLRIVGDRIPIKIIPNPAPIFTPSNECKNNWIISVGRLHKEKGFLRLIQAFSQIRSLGDWKLVLIGDGVHRKEIIEYVNHLNLEDKVIFTGKVKNVHEWLSKSEIFVLASHHEGFPNALLEACSIGLACISFDIVAGPSDIISNNDNGILLNDNDINGLSLALETLINDSELRQKLGERAKKSMDRFHLEFIGNEFLSFTKKCVIKWKQDH